MFLGGDLGRWNDDYEFNQRTPETGKFERLTEPMEGQFWRPLFFAINPALQTLFWDRPRIIHAVQGVLHGVAALALFRMLGALGVSRAVRSPVTLLFLACPIVFQAIFWASSIPTVLSAAAFMLATALYAEWVRGERGVPGIVVFIVLGVLIPLLNEQPAPALAALPLLWLGARAAPRRIGPVRALAPLLVVGVLHAAYLAAYLATTPPGYPATGATLVHGGQIGPRLAEFVSRAAECLAMGGRWGWFFDEGWRTLGAAGLWGVVCAGGLVIAGAAWTFGARPAEPDGPGRPPMSRRAAALFGLLAFGLAWTPIFLITTYEPASRLFYIPFIGLAVFAAAACDAIRARTPYADGVRTASRALVAAASVFGAVCLVGAQRAFRDSHRADASYADQLRALLTPSTPDMPGAPDGAPRVRPGLFFVPVRIDDAACRADPTWLDLNFHTILLSPINVRMWIKDAMSRSDVYCGSYSPDHGAYPSADARGLGFAWKFVDRSVPEDPPGVWRVPWASVVPFEIDGLGSVRIVPRIVLERADNADAAFTVAEGDARWGRSCAFYDRGADAGVRPLGAWTWDSGGTVEFERAHAWTAVHTAARFSVASGRGGARTPLPATPAVSTLYFRVTLPERQVLAAPGKAGVAARVVWTAAGAGTMELGSTTISSESVAADQRWMPMTLTVPPHPGEDWVLRVSIGPVGDLEVATPLVTAGLWSARMP